MFTTLVPCDGLDFVIQTRHEILVPGVFGTVRIFVDVKNLSLVRRARPVSSYITQTQQGEIGNTMVPLVVPVVIVPAMGEGGGGGPITNGEVHGGITTNNLQLTLGEDTTTSGYIINFARIIQKVELDRVSTQFITTQSLRSGITSYATLNVSNSKNMMMRAIV